MFTEGCIGLRTYPSFPGDQLINYLSKAEVFDDYLSVQGQWNRPWKVSEYGVRVIKAEDDKGRSLEFKSFQFAYMKLSIFELEFTRPEDDAQSVSVDVVFVSNRETQRITQSMPLKRPGFNSYATMRTWFEEPPAIEAHHK
ncbi:hypothetical protein B7486_34175 [cyanobacterium TDX16]|nr:hypothetical protein B7486_34175 [cyanobacterium TDX16]